MCSLVSKTRALKRGRNQVLEAQKGRYTVAAEGVPWVPLFLADYRPMAVCARPPPVSVLLAKESRMATSELDERRVRAAKNESLFRAVNERIEDISEAFDLSKRAIDFVCECADPNCSAVIELTHEEYESIRRAPTHFAIKPGHEMPEIEQVMAG